MDGQPAGPAHILRSKSVLAPASPRSLDLARDVLYGRKYFGNERTSLVVDSEGVVAEVLRKVEPAEHDERVLAALAHIV